MVEALNIRAFPNCLLFAHSFANHFITSSHYHFINNGKQPHIHHDQARRCKRWQYWQHPSNDKRCGLPYRSNETYATQPGKGGRILRRSQRSPILRRTLCIHEQRPHRGGYS